MRLARDLRSPLPLALALSAGALFFGGNLGDSRLPWLGGAALLLALLLLATQPPPARLGTLVPFALLAVWCAASVAWSIEPDRSWSYANRAFVYLAFALVGALLGVSPRGLFDGACALLGAVCVWSLLGKVFPWLYEYYGTAARLSSPVGYWNSLALLGAIALPLGLCLSKRRRALGTLLVFGWLVAIGLTYSRGGIVVAAVVVVAWMLLSGAWLDAVTTLVAAAVPAAVALAVAFSLAGVTDDGESQATRLHDGLAFGAVLLACAGVAWFLARVEPPTTLPRRARQTGVALLALACAAAVVLGGLHARHWWDSFTSNAEVTNSSSRVLSTGSNFRSSWWTEAWQGFEHNPIKGTGAGTFSLTNERYQTSDQDIALEPHDLPLQFLTETGAIGFVLFLAAMGALVGSARHERGPELALALALPAYLLHSLLDIDWDYVAVSAPVFLIAGALAVRPSARRRVSPFAVLAAGGIAAAVFVSLFAVWLGERWVNEAGATSNPQRELALLDRARSIDPLSIDVLIQQATTEALLGNERAEFADLEKATTVQPQNAWGWGQLGAFELASPQNGGLGCPRAALTAFGHATVLEGQYIPYSTGYAEALKKVNSGLPRC